MTHESPRSEELENLRSKLDAEAKTVNIRLREGEYQHSLARAIASFELELHFPDVKDLVRKLFGERKTEDSQFVSKIQTILKKMEKSGVIKILPKKKPWELQRYVLSSFKFQDVEKNMVVFASKPDVEKALSTAKSKTATENKSMRQTSSMSLRVYLSVVTVITAYSVILWTLAQPIVNVIIFGLAFCIAVACSIVLGVWLSRNKETVISAEQTTQACWNL